MIKLTSGISYLSSSFTEPGTTSSGIAPDSSSTPVTPRELTYSINYWGGSIRALSRAPVLNAQISGSTSIISSGSVEVSSVGVLEGSTSVTSSSLGTLGGSGALQASLFGVSTLAGGDITFKVTQAASATVQFNLVGDLQGKGTLDGTGTVTVGTFAVPGATGVLEGASAVSVSGLGTATESGGSADGSSTVAISDISFLTGKGALTASSTLSVTGAGNNTASSGVAIPLQAGFRYYTRDINAAVLSRYAGALALVGTGQVAVSGLGELTGAAEGRIRADVTLSIGHTAPIQAKGSLVGTGAVSVGTSAVPSNADGDEIFGSTSITTSDSADIIGVGVMEASATIEIVPDVLLSADLVYGSETISIGHSADIGYKNQISASESISITVDAEARRVGLNLEASNTIAITTSAAGETYTGIGAADTVSLVVNNAKLVGKGTFSGNDKPGVRKSNASKGFGGGSGRRSIVSGQAA